MRLRSPHVLLALAASLSITLSARAESAPDFEKRKAEAVTEIDQRILKLQEHKTCVGGATNVDALKECHSKMVQWREGERAEHLEKRNARMEERLKMRHAKKTTAQ